jgi:hypothetical protein
VVAELILSLQSCKNLQQSSTSRYNSNSGALQSAITVIAACRAPLPHTFTANKVPVNTEITFLLFKERRPFKLKKEYPSEQRQIISF